jgi:hypothetical protein
MDCRKKDTSNKSPLFHVFIAMGTSISNHGLAMIEGDTHTDTKIGSGIQKLMGGEGGAKDTYTQRGWNHISLLRFLKNKETWLKIYITFCSFLEKKQACTVLYRMFSEKVTNHQNRPTFS